MTRVCTVRMYVPINVNSKTTSNISMKAAILINDVLDRNGTVEFGK